MIKVEKAKNNFTIERINREDYIFGLYIWVLVSYL